MTRLIIIPLILLSLLGNSQISLGVYQDVKLATMTDDAGNTPFTTDVHITLDLQGYKSFGMKVLYEYADLSGGKFTRYSVHAGYLFDKLIVKNFEVGAYFGIGAIHRDLWIDSQFTYSLLGELNYRLSERFKLSSHFELLNRSDLKALGYDGGFKPNVSIGGKYIIFNK
jgi:hypothetical protein